MVRISIDKDLVDAVSEGELTQEAAMLAQVIRNQEATKEQLSGEIEEVKKNSALRFVPK